VILLACGIGTIAKLRVLAYVAQTCENFQWWKLVPGGEDSGQSGDILLFVALDISIVLSALISAHVIITSGCSPTDFACI
jgi:hypothetical protein